MICRAEIIIPRDEQGKPKPVPINYNPFGAMERGNGANKEKRSGIITKIDGKIITIRDQPAPFNRVLRCSYCGSPMAGRQVVYKVADGTWKKSNLIYYAYIVQGRGQFLPNEPTFRAKLTVFSR